MSETKFTQGPWSDADLIQFCTDFREGFLGDEPSDRMCFAISAPLSALLTMEGVPNTLTEGDLGDCNHFWLTLDDGRVLDPTADQFNHFAHGPLPPVYLGQPTAIHPTATKEPT